MKSNPKNRNPKSQIPNPKSPDVIIIGGGAAGLSAALWCDELGLGTVILEKEAEFGGQLLRVYNQIENHLGITTAQSGREMRDIFLEQTKRREFTRRLQAEVTGVDLLNKRVVLSDGEELSAKALIIATGVRRRKLNVEGEDLFKGKGILESGKNEQNSVAGKTVLIVGGGDAAIENSLSLAERAKKIYVAHRRKQFRARAEFLEKARANPKIEFLTETAVQKIGGGEKIENVELKNSSSNEIRNLSVDAILIRIGVAPNTKIFRGKLDLDEKGYIRISNLCETSLKGVFAVGDVANPLAPTVSTAVGTGATAAKAVFAWLNSPQRL